MTASLCGSISGKNGIIAVLKTILLQANLQYSVLKIKNEEIAGEVGFSQGRYITGAFIENIGATGLKALKGLLQVRQGEYEYRTVSDDSIADLNQGMHFDIKSLIDLNSSQDSEENAATLILPVEELSSANMKDASQTEDFFNIKLSQPKKIAIYCISIILIGVMAIVVPLILSARYAKKAENLANAQLYERALSKAKRATILNPFSPKAHRIKGFIHEQLGQNSQALAEYNFVLKMHPQDRFALRHGSEVLLKLGKYPDAIGHLNQIITFMGKDTTPGIYYLRAIAHQRSGDTAAAIKDCNYVLKSDPLNVHLLIVRANSYRQAKQIDKAIDDYDLAIKLGLQDANTYFARGLCKKALRQYGGAIADFSQALKLKLDDPVILSARGLSYERVNDFTNACRDFERVQKVDPLSPNALFSLLERARLHSKERQYETALKDLNGAESIGKPDANFLAERAEIYMHLSDYEKAAKDYSEAIKKDPDSLRSYLGLAVCHSQNSNLQAALKDIEHDIKLQPNNARFYTYHALYGLLYGNRQSVEEDLYNAIKLNKNNGSAYMCRGVLHMQKHEYVSAKDDFDLALLYDPNLSEAGKLKEIAIDRLKKRQTGSSSPQLSDAGTLENKDDKKLLKSGTFKQLLAAGYEQLKNGDCDRAINLLEAAVHRDPNNVSARRYLSHAVAMSGDYAVCIIQLHELARLDPDNTDDLRFLADTYIKAEKRGEAINTYNRYLQIKPEDCGVRCSLAMVYAANGSLDKAKEICLDGIQRATSASNAAAAAKYKATLQAIGNAVVQPSTAVHKKINEDDLGG